jgi:hypothetical protein
MIDDLVIHGAAELRVRVQDERNRRIRRWIVVVTGFNPAGRTADIHFGHEGLTSNVAGTLGEGLGALRKDHGALSQT